jgi:hypothetical protein
LQKKAHSIAEAARLLSLKPDEIEWLVDTGQLKTILIAGHRLVMSKDIDDLLEVYREVQSRAVTGRSKKEGRDSRLRAGARKALTDAKAKVRFRKTPPQQR